LVQPGVWIGFTFGAVVLFGLSALLASSWLVPGNLGMWGADPPGTGAFLLTLTLLAGWVGLGVFLLHGVALGVLDARSGTVEIVRLVVEESRPARHAGQHIYFLDAGGVRQCAVIPAGWALGVLPKSIELWRSRYGKTALRLRIA